VLHDWPLLSHCTCFQVLWWLFKGVRTWASTKFEYTVRSCGTSQDISTSIKLCITFNRDKPCNIVAAQTIICRFHAEVFATVHRNKPWHFWIAVLLLHLSRESFPISKTLHITGFHLPFSILLEAASIKAVCAYCWCNVSIFLSLHKYGSKAATNSVMLRCPKVAPGCEASWIVAKTCIYGSHHAELSPCY